MAAALQYLLSLSNFEFVGDISQFYCHEDIKIPKIIIPKNLFILLPPQFVVIFLIVLSGGFFAVVSSLLSLSAVLKDMANSGMNTINSLDLLTISIRHSQKSQAAWLLQQQGGLYR